LTNISDSPVEIDPWSGDWFISVFDEKLNVVSNYTRVSDQLRPLATPKILQSGEKWDTEIMGLRLKTGLGDSTPDWEYSPLKPGIYWLGGQYTALPSAGHPKMWLGALDTELIKIKIVEH